MAENKKTKASSDAVRPENLSVGATLRAARLAKGLKIEDVSAALRIRSVQLRALEEDDIDALPGRTYAVGFVRNYANCLGLNGVEVVHKFKAESGQAPVNTKLAFPEPEVESRMPSPATVGIGAFLAASFLIVWTIYSNIHSGSKVAEVISPTPPVVETPPPLMEVATPSATTTTEETALRPAPLVIEQAAPPAPMPKIDAALDAAADIKVPEIAVSKTEVAKETKEAKEEKTAKDNADKKDKTDNKEDIINIKSGKSRVTLRAKQDSWVEVSDGKGNVVFYIATKVEPIVGQFFAADGTLATL